MSNFRLNLPVDIPWTFIRCSHDMMDDTWCNKKSPSPFRSSLALYAYEPKAEELPAELCGNRITYLKVSCSITGYQPEESEKEQIVRLLETAEVDYSKIEQIVGEYFGCYGVLLNVSVHPYDKELKDDFRKYPRIIDFEPKIRDFYQAASETGEVLTASIGRVSTSKSFTATDSTQSSWQVGAKATVPAELMMATTGVPVGLEANGTTGQVRTETDQENWTTATDASRERREGQSTTTQLSQMYNLLTGYHTGTNRAAFVMLPRPHILQPTDRRTFVQGLRVIEGIQDFFLVVVRPPGEDRMKVDVHLQTGHFPEDIEVEETVPPEEQFGYKSMDVASFSEKCLGLGVLEGVGGAIADAFGGPPPSVPTDVTGGLVTFDGFEADGWEFDPNQGDSGHKSIKEIKRDDDTLSDYDGISFEKHTYKVVSPDQVLIEISVKNKNMAPWDAAYKAKFSRKYKVYLRRPTNVEVNKAADIAGLLITQRALCAEIQFGDCIGNVFSGEAAAAADAAGGWLANESPFRDLGDIPYYSEPTISGSGSSGSGSPGSGNSGSGSWGPPVGKDGSPGLLARTRRSNPRADFAFKKAILRKIQQVLVTSASSPFRYKPGEVGFLQTKHFQRRLLKVLPDKVLDKNVRELEFVDARIKEKINLSLRELLSTDDSQSAAKAQISSKELKELKAVLFREERKQE